MKKSLSFLLAGVFALVLLAQAAHPPHAHEAGLWSPHADCGVCASSPARASHPAPTDKFSSRAPAPAEALLLAQAAVLTPEPHFHHNALAPPPTSIL